MLTHDGAFWWLAGRVGFMLHDDGWSIINRRRVEIASGKVPNVGYRRAWWRAK